MPALSRSQAFSPALTGGAFSLACPRGCGRNEQTLALSIKSLAAIIKTEMGPRV